MGSVLITGGCGFIGSNLAKAYIDRGQKVIIIDNLTTGRIQNLGDLPSSDLCELLMKDIGHTELSILMKNYHVEVVHHLAARPRVKYSVDHPLETNEENITNTLKVLKSARYAGVKRVVYSASSSAYGNTDICPTPETEPAHPLSPYALQKFVGEEYCRLFYELYGLDTVSLRYFNVFGPNSFADSEYSAVIPIFIEQICRNEALTIDGDGGQSRDFTYIDNVVEGNILAAQCENELQGRVINLACGDNISINGLAELLFDILERRVDKVYRDPRPGDVRRTQAAIDRAREILKYNPVTSFEEGLRRTVEWYMAYLESRDKR